MGRIERDTIPEEEDFFEEAMFPGYRIVLLGRRPERLFQRPIIGVETQAPAVAACPRRRLRRLFSIAASL